MPTHMLRGRGGIVRGWGWLAFFFVKRKEALYLNMPLLKDEARSSPVSAFITLTRDEKTVRENIRVSSNHISILDDEGESTPLPTQSSRK